MNPVRTPDELSAQLGRPPKSLSALCSLSPDEIAHLGRALHEAAERERRFVLEAEGSPRGLRWFVRLVVNAIRQ